MSDEMNDEYLEKRREKLEAGNNRSYNELRQKLGPQFVMDTGDMRRELMFRHLVKWGVISTTQALEFEIAFHERVEASLNEAWEEVRESEKGRNLTVVQKPSKLIGPDGRPLG